MKVEYRPYVCTVCGQHDSVQTNHEGPVLHICKGCSWKRDFAGKEHSHSIPALGNHTYRVFRYAPEVNEGKECKNMTPTLSEIVRNRKTLTLEQKQRVLKVLKSLREEYTGNVGGETDIANADNLQTNENEFTSGDAQPERNVVAKTFDTQADFDSYTNQRRGIEMTAKEVQAIQNYQEARPTELDKFHVKYEATDDFGNNDTTVIKKLKEGNQFVWTAFSKHETAEEEGKPEGAEDTVEEPALQEQAPGQHMPSEPEDSGGDEEVTVNDPIRITKSITFMDETQGADLLADFLAKLEI